MEDETRAMTRTRLTPMAEYQIDETSYKSVKIKLQVTTFTKIEEIS